MKSSFARKAGGQAADVGTRPGPYGQTLLSAGHADVDRLLGGGLPLGSLLLILEDGWSQHHTTLVRYFLAEGAAWRQTLLLASADALPGGLARFLPRQVQDKSEGRSAAAAGQATEGGTELRIAWQYGKYLKPQQPSSSQPGSGSAAGPGPLSLHHGGGGVMRTASSRAAQVEWCHQYDLTKASGAEGLAGSRAECRVVAPGRNSLAEVGPLAAQLVGSLAPQQPSMSPLLAVQPQHIGRLAVLSLGSLQWGAGAGTDACGRDVVQALLQIKAAVRDTRCAAVVTLSAALHSPSDLMRMQHIADAVIALESVTDDSDIVRLAPDSASVAGLLHLRKLPAMGALMAPVPAVALHLVRHKRRRLAITPAEIDPDAEAAAAEGAGGKSVASMLCSGPPRATNALDF